MTVFEMTAEVGEDRQVHLPPDCPIGKHRFLIYVDDSPQRLPKTLPLGEPQLREKNGVLVINLPDDPIPWLDTDTILNEMREEQIHQSVGLET